MRIYPRADKSGRAVLRAVQEAGYAASVTFADGTLYVDVEDVAAGDESAVMAAARAVDPFVSLTPS